jgi:hypothetical protein
MPTENTQENTLSNITDGDAQPVETLGSLDGTIEKTTEEAVVDANAPSVGEEGEKTPEEIKAETEAEKAAAEQANAEPVKEPAKEDKPDGFVTDDLVKKAQADIESLSEDEKQHLLDKGILKAEGATDSPNNDAFKTSLEAITGVELEVDFGDTPMDTPEGLAKYADAYADKRVENFEDSLATRFPQAYKALQIEAEGGDVTKFFQAQQVGETDYTKMELSENDSSQYKNIIRNSYALKGVDDSTIDDIIKLAEDNNKLKEKATPELKYLQNTQSKRAEAYSREVELQRGEDNRIMSIMGNTVDDLVNKGKVGNFTIPKADKSAFIDHLRSNIEYKGGKFYMTKEVTADSLENLAQGEFFNFKKGNLDKYITRAAKTKLVLNLEKNASGNKLSLSGNGLEEGYIPLGQLGNK